MLAAIADQAIAIALEVNGKRDAAAGNVRHVGGNQPLGLMQRVKLGLAFNPRSNLHRQLLEPRGRLRADRGLQAIAAVRT